MRLHSAARPVAAIIGLDPAYSGDAGLAVLVRGPVVPQPERKKRGVPLPPLAHADGVYLHAHRQGPPLTASAMRWVGERAAEVCRPGERVLFAAEATCFGSKAVSRKLGIGIGCFEGLLIDLNAMDEGSRLDWTVQTWRAACGIAKGIGRDRAKLRAIAVAKQLFGIELYADAAEAACIAYATHLALVKDSSARGIVEWGMHDRPRLSKPNGMKAGS